MQNQSTKPKLLDQLRDRIRLKHYSRRTEDVYLDWAKRYILYHKKRHPQEMGKKESVVVCSLPMAANCLPSPWIMMSLPGLSPTAAARCWSAAAG
jgi:hypothetical protein